MIPAAERANWLIRQLAAARLYVLLDGADTEDEFAARARTLVQAGTHVLQLRDKRLSDRLLLARAMRLRSTTAGTGTLLIVNDRPDIALLAGADGVHVGQDELPVAEVRRLVGAEMLIGVSTHDVEQAVAAERDGADYIGCGPTFPSATKQFASFPGLELLRVVRDRIQIPAFAIGGITAQRLPEVLATGFRRVAVSGAVTGAADPRAAVQTLLAALEITTPLPRTS